MSSFCDQVESCPRDLADHWAIVTAAYFLAFFPWAAVSLLDFIGPRWKTVACTRRNGIVQMLIVLPSMSYVAFYIHLQRVSGDFKEMSAGITALVFSFYHCIRTLMGLWQLYHFRVWAIKAVKTLLTLPGDRRKDDTTNKLKHKSDFDEMLKQAANVVDHLQINESIIDNEVNGEDELPCRLHSPLLSNILKWICKTVKNILFLPSLVLTAIFLGTFWKVVRAICWKPLVWCFCIVTDHKWIVIEPVYPMECTIRWMKAVIGQFGSSWLVGKTNSAGVDSRDKEIDQSVNALANNWDLERDRFAKDMLEFCMFNVTHRSSENKTFSSALPLQVPLKGSDFSREAILSTVLHSGEAMPYGTPATEDKISKKVDILQVFKNFKASIDKTETVPISILNKLPAEASEALSNVPVEKLELFAMIMYADATAKPYKKHKPIEASGMMKDYVHGGTVTVDGEMVPSNLQGFGFDDVHVPRLSTLIPVSLEAQVFMREGCLSEREGYEHAMQLSQVSVHLDNWIAFRRGEGEKRLAEVIKLKGIPFTEETGNARLTNRVEGKELIGFAEYERWRLRMDLLTSTFGHRHVFLEQTLSSFHDSFLGVLANSREDSEFTLETHTTADLGFTLSEELSNTIRGLKQHGSTRYKDDQRLSMRVLWECQRYLLERLHLEIPGERSRSFLTTYSPDFSSHRISDHHNAVLSPDERKVALSMLLIATYPSLSSEYSKTKTETDGVYCACCCRPYVIKIEIKPVYAPVETSIELTLTESTEDKETIDAKLTLSGEVEFSAKDWQEAHSEIVSAASKWRKDHSICSDIKKNQNETHFWDWTPKEAELSTEHLIGDGKCSFTKRLVDTFQSICAEFEKNEVTQSEDSEVKENEESKGKESEDTENREHQGSTEKSRFDVMKCLIECNIDAARAKEILFLAAKVVFGKDSKGTSGQLSDDRRALLDHIITVLLKQRGEAGAMFYIAMVLLRHVSKRPSEGSDNLSRWLRRLSTTLFETYVMKFNPRGDRESGDSEWEAEYGDALLALGREDLTALSANACNEEFNLAKSVQRTFASQGLEFRGISGLKDALWYLSEFPSGSHGEVTVLRALFDELYKQVVEHIDVSEEVSSDDDYIAEEIAHVVLCCLEGWGVKRNVGVALECIRKLIYSKRVFLETLENVCCNFVETLSDAYEKVLREIKDPTEDDRTAISRMTAYVNEVGKGMGDKVVAEQVGWEEYYVNLQALGLSGVS